MPQGKKIHISILIVLLSSALFVSCSQKESLRSSANKNRTKKAAVTYQSPNWLKKQKAIQTITKELKKDDISKVETIAEKVLLEASMDNHQAIQIEASIGLGYLNSRTSLSMLLVLAVPPASDNVRWHAIQSLKRRNSPLALKAYLIGLKSNDWVIREASIIGFLSLKSKNEQKRHLQGILNSLNDPTVSVRISTLKHLQLRDRRIYRDIIKNLNKKKPVALVAASLTAINGYMLDTKTKETVIELLSHPSTRIRILALRALKMDRKIRLERH